MFRRSSPKTKEDDCELPPVPLCTPVRMVIDSNYSGTHSHIAQLESTAMAKEQPFSVPMRFAYRPSSLASSPIDSIAVDYQRAADVRKTIAIAVHPEDPRYQELVAKRQYTMVIHPEPGHSLLPVIAMPNVISYLGHGCVPVIIVEGADEREQLDTLTDVPQAQRPFCQKSVESVLWLHEILRAQTMATMNNSDPMPTNTQTRNWWDEEDVEAQSRRTTTRDSTMDDDSATLCYYCASFIHAVKHTCSLVYDLLTE